MRYIILLIFSLFLFSNSSFAGPPEEVKTGVYLMNLYGLNMDENSFYADFYIWFKWKGKKDPSNIEFVNLIEKWSKDQTGFDGDSTPVTLKDGSKYKIMRVEGRFFHSYSLGDFPLDRHALDIQIENPEYPADSLVYVPDTAAADIRHNLKQVGWDVMGCSLTNSIHDYGSNFGNPQENAQRYSNIQYSVILQRPFSYFLLKMLLPLVVVMLVSIGALALHPTHIDTRSSLPIGGLLTAVFLQQSYSGALPDTGYMVLMDKIYLLCYILISLVLVNIIRSGNEMERQVPADKIIKRERLQALIYLIIFIAGVEILAFF
jgi:hypothetical protein